MSTTLYQIAGAACYPLLGVVASFFWVRGLWRDTLSDRVLSCCVFGVMCILGIVFGSSSDGFIAAGLWLCFLGVVTLAGGLFFRTRGWSFYRAFRTGGLMIIIGVLFGMML